MIVCLCHAVTDRDLERMVAQGVSTVDDVARCSGAGTGCGACREEIAEKLSCGLGGDADQRCPRTLVSVRSARR